MPNKCRFSMKVKGSKESREAFIRKMDSYDEPNHFWRVFECICEEDNDEYSVINGHCAWSLNTCGGEEGYSEGTDLFAVNTAELGLELEAYSLEPMYGFEEHLVYSNGECLVSECADVDVYWWEYMDYVSYEYVFDCSDEANENEEKDPFVRVEHKAIPFEEFKKENELPEDVTEEDMITDGYFGFNGEVKVYVEDGFGKWEWTI